MASLGYIFTIARSLNWVHPCRFLGDPLIHVFLPLFFFQYHNPKTEYLCYLIFYQTPSDQGSLVCRERSEVIDRAKDINHPERAMVSESLIVQPR